MNRTSCAPVVSTTSCTGSIVGVIGSLPRRQKMDVSTWNMLRAHKSSTRRRITAVKKVRVPIQGMTLNKTSSPSRFPDRRLDRLLTLRWDLYRGALLLPPLAATFAVSCDPGVAELPWQADLLTNFVPLVGFAAFIGAFFGTRRQRWLCAASALACAALVGNVWLRQAPTAEPSPSSPSPPVVRVAAANVHSRNPNHAPFLAWLKDANADIIAVLEVSPEWARTLAAQAAYPYQKVLAQRDDFGIALLSRHPLEQVRVLDGAGDLPPSIEATVRLLDGRTIHVAATHTLPPMGRNGLALRNQQLAMLATLAAQRPEQPFILLGDLNATPWSQGMALPRKAGLRLVDPLTPTWPAKGAVFGLELLRLDHVLVSREIQVKGSQRGPKIDSDHRPVLADLMF